MTVWGESAAAVMQINHIGTMLRKCEPKNKTNFAN